MRDKKTMSYLQDGWGKSRNWAMEELQKRNIWNGNCIGQRINKKEYKPYEVKGIALRRVTC